MFRCGSSYQDRPCDAGQPARVIQRNGAARDEVPAAPAARAIDADCADRGLRAQQIVWAKESGKTASAQLDAATSDLDRRLIPDVYRRRGSSLDVRQGVEADCLAEKDRAAQAAALMEAAARLRGGDPAASSPLPGRAPESRLAEAGPARALTVGATAGSPERQARCRDLKGHLDALAANLRTGGSIGQVEQFNRQQQSAAKAWRDVGC